MKLPPSGRITRVPTGWATRWVWVFFLLERVEILMFWKAIFSVLRGRFCLKYSLNRTNWLSFVAYFYLVILAYIKYSILIYILGVFFKVSWTSILEVYSVRCSCMNIIRIIRTECQNQDFSHLNRILSGLGIFKQNWENLN